MSDNVYFPHQRLDTIARLDKDNISLPAFIVLPDKNKCSHFQFDFFPL